MTTLGSQSSSYDVGSSVLLATGGYDNSIRFWSVHTGQTTRVLPQIDPHINAMEITPDKQNLAVASYQKIKLYDVHCKITNPVIQFESVSKNVTAVGFHDDGRWMYSGGEDGYGRIWDMRSQNYQSQKMYAAKSPINCAVLHPNQTEIYLGDLSGYIHIWDIRNNKYRKLQVDNNDNSINHISIEPYGNCLAAVDNKGNCYTFSLNVKYASSPLASKIDIDPMQRKLKLKAHKRYALKCKFSPDCTLLATTSADQTAKIWRTADLLPLSERPENDSNQANALNSNWPLAENLSPLALLTTNNQRWVWDVAFSNDSQYVLTASSDCIARLWSVTTAEIKREYTGHQRPLTALAFSDTMAD